MDRNTSNEPAYRPTADTPASQMPFGEPEYSAVGGRHVLARMPNLASIDPDADPIEGYPRREDNRVLSAGLSVKLLAGVSIVLVLVAITGFSVAGRKTATEAASTPVTASQSPSPQSTAEQMPRWDAAAANGTNWQGGTSPNAISANGSAVSPPWSTPTDQSQQGSYAQTSSRSGKNPTELPATAGPATEPLWGQAQTSAPNSSLPANMWNSSPPMAASSPAANSSSYDAPTRSPWPGPAGSAPMSPSPAASDPRYSMSASGTPGVSSPYAGSYQQAQPSPAYAGSLAGANQSMALGASSVNPPAANRPAADPQYDSRFGPSKNYTADYNPDRGTASQRDPRLGYGATSGANQAAALQQPAQGSAPGSYYSADTRSASVPNYGAPVQSSPMSSSPSPIGSPSFTPPANGNFPVPAPVTYPPSGGQSPAMGATGYPSGSSFGGSVSAVPAPGYGYPAPGSYPSGAPTGGYSNGYPSGSSYPSGSTYPSAAPANGYPSGVNPSSGYVPNNAASGYPNSGYPSATAPMGATSVPRYNSGASMVAPQAGTAQFEGGIDKPSVQGSYDRSRSGLY